MGILRVAVFGAAAVVCACGGAKKVQGGGTSAAGTGGSSASSTAAAGTGGTMTSVGSLSAGAGGQTPCQVAASAQPGSTCKVKVTIGSFVLSNMLCTVDAPFQVGDTGDLTFACDKGPAKLVFAKGEFTGTSDMCVLHLTRTTQFPFQDGCTWQSDQKMDGTLGMKLKYTYSEKPISGQFCSMPCTVDADLTFGMLGPISVENPK
jgi:hypothetical protein